MLNLYNSCIRSASPSYAQFNTDFSEQHVSLRSKYTPPLPDISRVCLCQEGGSGSVHSHRRPAIEFMSLRRADDRSLRVEMMIVRSNCGHPRLWIIPPGFGVAASLGTLMIVARCAPCTGGNKNDIRHQNVDFMLNYMIMKSECVERAAKCGSRRKRSRKTTSGLSP